MKIALLSPDPKSLQAIQQTLTALDGYVYSAQCGNSAALSGLLDAHTPDVLLCELGADDERLLEALERACLRQPQLVPILLTAQPTPAVLIAAMRAGIREVLPLPLDAHTLTDALQRVREQRRQAAQPSRDGKVLAFIPCKGGSGSTFIAANLAYALAHAASGSRVLLIDLNLQFGDAALFLSNAPTPSHLAELAGQIDRLDAALLCSSLLWLDNRLGILPSPEDPAAAMEVQAAHIEALIRLARREFDFVLLDLGRTLDPVSIRALDLADTIFPVLQATLPFIRDAKRMLDIFTSLGYPADKISLIVNRHAKGGDIGQGDIERTLARKIAHILPNNYQAAAASVNQGVPVARLAPSSPIARALDGFASALAPQNAASPSWWGKLLGRNKPAYALVTEPGYKA
ncbi:AAA family ATPase [Craterilacuibacter sp.]|uniref:AAA family ATPase n=1 Tax=Craterilacuibacter sp. TaxID=2870909 RepID=UPI003F2F1D1A